MSYEHLTTERAQAQFRHRHDRQDASVIEGLVEGWSLVRAYQNFTRMIKLFRLGNRIVAPSTEIS